MRRPTGRELLAPLIAASVQIVGCDAPVHVSDSPEVEIRDSAGVTIVVNSGPTRLLDVREVLRVGVVDGDPDYQFHRVYDLAVDSVGGFWVSDSDEALRHYSSTGEYLGAVGGRGEGPGEAEGYGSVLTGDHTLLVQASPARLQLFASDGSFLSQINSRSERDGYWVDPIGWAGDRWVMRGESRQECPTTPYRGAMPIFESSMAPGAPFREYLVFEGQLFNPRPNCSSFRASIFHGDPTVAAVPTGGIVRSDTIHYRVERYSPDGVLERVITRITDPRPIDPAWRDDIGAGLVAEMAPRYELANVPIPYDRIEESVQRAWPEDPPDHLPFIEGWRALGLSVDGDGRVWVRRADLHPRPGMRAAAHHDGSVPWAWPPEWRAPSHFDVFDSDGLYLGSIELPPEFTPMDVGAGRIYGTIYDDLDVQYVVAYDVEFGGGG